MSEGNVVVEQRSLLMLVGFDGGIGVVLVFWHGGAPSLDIGKGSTGFVMAKEAHCFQTVLNVQSQSLSFFFLSHNVFRKHKDKNFKIITNFV